MASPIRIFVGEHKALTVTIPSIAPRDLLDILGTFLSRGNDDARRDLEKILRESKSLTLVLTTLD